MEAFRALAAGDLPPAGNPVLSGPGGDLPIFPGYTSVWLDCGTSALALALVQAKIKRPDLIEPKVILPAYCCPDLLAAANYAGVQPVLVDISLNDPSYDLDALQRALSHQVIAVIAVSFLGIRERLDDLKVLLQGKEIALIEDNAQWFPEVDEEATLLGDYVVFSFGRGKPVSLLGGGLLLSRSPIAVQLPVNKESPYQIRLKYFLYNLLRRPFFYRLLNRNPLLRLGETRYHSLESVALLDTFRKTLVTTNVLAYHQLPRNVEAIYDEHLAGINDLAPLLIGQRRRRLLRYPVLLPETVDRNALVKDLARQGFGTTALYQKPLSGLEDLEYLGAVDNWPNAKNFASRFLTLPVHSSVSIERARQVAQALVTAIAH